MPPRPDQPWGESRLWRLFLPTLVAPALAVAGAALAGMAYFTTEAHAHPLPSAPDTAGSSDSSRTAAAGATKQVRPTTAPGPEQFHSGSLEGDLVTPASSDPAGPDMGPRKAGFGYGLRVDRDPLPETRAPMAARIGSTSPVGTAPPQPEFTPD